MREQVTIEAEVGPIRYIAELIYGESTKKVLEDAVRAVIILLVLVFDPLAVLLLIAANMSFRDMKRKEKRVRRKKDKKSLTETRHRLENGIIKVTQSTGNIETNHYE